MRTGSGACSHAITSAFLVWLPDAQTERPVRVPLVPQTRRHDEGRL